MRNKRVSGIVVLILIIGMMFNSFISISALTIIHDTEEYDMPSEEFAYRTFRSNYSNRFYALYDEYKVGVWYIFYSTSQYGLSWTNGTRLLNTSGVNLGTNNFDYYLEPNGRYIHFAWIMNTDDMYYAKREINATTGELHTISGTASHYRVTNGALGNGWGSWEFRGGVSIIVDSEGYPIIGGYLATGTPTYNYGVYRCPTNDSIWLFNTYDDRYMMESEWMANGGGNLPNNVPFQGVLVPATGKDYMIYFVYWSSSGAQEFLVGMYWDDSDDDWEDNFSTFNDNEGGDWADQCWSIGYNIDANISVVLKQHESNPDGQIGLESRVYNQTDRTQTSNFQVSWDVAGDAGSFVFNPFVSINENGSIIYMWTITGNSSYWYRRMYPNGTLETTWTERTAPYNIEHEKVSASPTALSPMSIIFEDDINLVDDILYHDYIEFLDDPFIIPFEYYNTTLYNDDGTINDGWIFEGEIYTFVTWVNNASYFYLNFTDGQHEILFRYDNATGDMWIETNERFVIGEIYTNYTIDALLDTRLTWRFIPDIDIVDIANTTLFYTLANNPVINDTTGIVFNIYNLGGLTYYTFTGDGGRTPYGGAFDLHATNGTEGSTAKAEQIFRKLQHVNFLFEIDMNNEWDAGNDEFDIDAGVGYVDIGIDYRLNGSWVDGFKNRIYVFDADVGHHAGAVDHDWVLWSIDFYNYDPNTGSQQNLQTNYIYSNHWGYDRENFVPDHHINRTSSQLWVDLWFDKTNASTTIATQMNAYYHGMREQGSAWWFGYGTFTPMISDYDNAKFLDYLYDEGGNVTNCQKYELMRFYIEVGKTASVDGDDETWVISTVEDMHREEAIDRMRGIDEPTFVETKIMDMPQTGFLNAIKDAINGLSKLIWSGAFQFIKLLMGAVGGFMNAIGLGDWYIAFNTALTQLSTYSLNLMDDMIDALINSALLLTQLQNMIALTIGRYIYFVTSFIGAIIAWYQGIVDLFTGGGIFSLDVWTGLSLGDWFGLGMNLLPIWWLNRLGNSDHMFDTMKDDLSWTASLVTGVFKFLISIIMLGITIIDMLWGLLPI